MNATKNPLKTHVRRVSLHSGIYVYIYVEEYGVIGKPGEKNFFYLKHCFDTAPYG